MTELPAGPWGTQGRRDHVTGQDPSRDSLPPQGGAARGQLSTRLLVPGARAREAGAATPQTGRGHRGAWGTPGEGRPAGGLHDGSWPGPQQSSPAFSSADEEGWDGGTSLPLTQSRVGAQEGTACRPRPPGSRAGWLGNPPARGDEVGRDGHGRRETPCVSGVGSPKEPGPLRRTRLCKYFP